MQLKFGSIDDEFAAKMEKSAKLSAAAAAKSDAGAAAPAAGKKFKWATSLDSVVKFDHGKAVGCTKLTLGDGRKLKALERAEKGSEGLFFAQFEDAEGRTLGAVLKRSKAPGAEVFFSLLTQYLGVPTGRIRIIDTNSEEGASLLHEAKALDPSGAVRSTLFAQSYLLFMDYLRGKSFNEIDYSFFRKHLGAEADADALRTSRLLKDIGSMMVLDVLTNNCDRFPLIWEHRGNPGNIMVDRDDGSCAFSIDGQIIGIDNAEGRADYMGRVSTLLTDRNFSPIREKIAEWTDYNIGEAGEEAIRAGFDETVAKVVEGHADLRAAMSTWREALAAISDPPLPDMAQIDLKFVEDVMDHMVASLKK